MLATSRPRYTVGFLLNPSILRTLTFGGSGPYTMLSKGSTISIPSDLVSLKTSLTRNISERMSIFITDYLLTSVMNCKKKAWEQFDKAFDDFTSYSGYTGQRFLLSNSTKYSKQKGLRRAKIYSQLTSLMPFVIRGLKAQFQNILYPAVVRLVVLNTIRATLLSIPPEEGISESDLKLLKLLDVEFVKSLGLL